MCGLLPLLIHILGAVRIGRICIGIGIGIGIGIDICIVFGTISIVTRIVGVGVCIRVVCIVRIVCASCAAARPLVRIRIRTIIVGHCDFAFVSNLVLYIVYCAEWNELLTTNF